MPKTEKVLKGLECCLFNDGFGNCEDCPYRMPGGCDDLLRDALELLKTQEPRVMTLEEAKNSVFCFCESGSVFACRMFVDPADGFATILQFGRPDILIDSNEYGISFRCWTSRPTDEQREATPWQ